MADLAQATVLREEVAPSLEAAEGGGGAGVGTHSRSTTKPARFWEGDFLRGTHAEHRAC